MKSTIAQLCQPREWRLAARIVFAISKLKRHGRL